MATLLFLYITILTVMGVVKSPSKCSIVGIHGIVWVFGGMIFALIYCTAGISDFGSSPYWVCSVFGYLGNNPYYWNWHQPCPEPRCCYHIQQGSCMG
ncbi:unnamed protein product [Camellia sinensis]